MKLNTRKRQTKTIYLFFPVRDRWVAVNFGISCRYINCNALSTRGTRNPSVPFHTCETNFSKVWCYTYDVHVQNCLANSYSFTYTFTFASNIYMTCVPLNVSCCYFHYFDFSFVLPRKKTHNFIIFKKWSLGQYYHVFSL